MDHIQRVTRMEHILNEGASALEQLSTAWDQYRKVEKSLYQLSDYYSSPQWLTDFDLDRQGGFPADLKRGVLSEDGIWDLLTDWDRLRKEIREHLEQGQSERSPME